MEITAETLYNESGIENFRNFKRRECYAKISFFSSRLKWMEQVEPIYRLADVDLAPEGVEEAKEGGRKIKEAGIELR
mgnify:CR=1 FL=1